MSQPDYVLPRSPQLSPLAYRLLLVAAIVVVAWQLPGLLQKAYEADAVYRGTVPTIGDDHDYHTMAVNLVSGLGWENRYILPLQDYHLDLTSAHGATLPAGSTIADTGILRHRFYRAPGFALLLSGVYAVFGTQAIVARLLLAGLTWQIGLLMVLIGRLLDRGLGVIAGCLAALVFLRHPMFEFGRILTEIPTTYWITLFAALYIWYLKQPSRRRMFVASLALTAAIFTRSNFVLAIPLLLLGGYVQRRSLWPSLVLASVVLPPVLLWSAFASLTNGTFVAFTTQNEIAFPQYNNIDVLEGVGPERYFQGGWNPGWLRAADGSWYSLYRYAPGEGENGWLMGLRFWAENPQHLPRLFYVKLRAGLWTEIGSSLPSGQYLGAISLLIMALGCRARSAPPVSRREFTPAGVFIIQILLALITASGGLPFWAVLLLIWPAMSLLSVLWPYGSHVRLGFPNPAWFLAFVAAHGLVTVVFGGEHRFHHPLDGLLFFFGLLLWLVILNYAWVRLKQPRALRLPEAPG